MATFLSESVIAATAGLIALPLITRRFRRSFLPGEHVHFNTATMIAGLVLLEMALIVCALPIMAAVTGWGSPDRHFFPGDTIVGAASAVFALTAAGSLLYGYGRFRRAQSLLVIEPWIGAHVQRGDHELVVLDSEQRVAYALGGKQPQIVITGGLIAALTHDELNAVIDHEVAHIRLRHRPFLAIIAALEPAARLVHPLRHILVAAQFAVEHWADRAVENPEAGRRALIKLGGAQTPVSAAAFASGHVADRINALAEPSDRRRARLFRPLLYGVALSLVGLSLAALVMYWY